MTRLRGPDATHQIGAQLGRCIAAGDVIGLVGDLGAGKTLFVQGLAEGLGVPPETRITSPTFTLLNEIRGGALVLYHADLYRIERARELDELGLDEAFDAGGVAAVEWCDRFDVLPSDHVRIHLGVISDVERDLSVRGMGPRSQELVFRWSDTWE